MQKQLNMLEGELGARAYGARFKPGDIVRQNWPWLGHYQVAFVYFQVRSWELHNELDYLCMPVPYGSHYNDVNWLPERYLVPAGGWFDVPSYDKLRESGIIGRYYRQHMGDPWEEGWPAEYMESIQRVNRTPTGAGSPFFKEGCPFPDMAPFAWERDIVAFLDTLPVKWYECTRDNWYEKFPEDSEAINGISKP